MKFKLWNCDIKKIFKRLLPIALATIIVFSFAGCGSKEQGGQSNVEPDPPYTTPVDPSTQNPSTPSTPTNPDDKKDPGKDPDDQDPDDKQDPTTPTDPDDKKDPDNQDPDTPPVVEEFSLAENKDKILTNIKPLINYSAIRLMGTGTTVDKVYDIAIENQGSDTQIETIYSGLNFNKSSNYIQYVTITLSNQLLTYEQIAKNNMEFNQKNISCNSKYSFAKNIAMDTQYSVTIQTIQKKLFDNYDNALWLGWAGTNSPQYDEHKLVCYDGKQIKETHVHIKNDGRTLAFPSGAVEKYLLQDDYTISDDIAPIILPSDTLLAQIQKELQEKEQQEI